MTTLSFPSLPGLEFPINRSNLGFNVGKQESLSGLRSRYAKRSIPQYRWTISFSLLRDSSIPYLTTFSDLSSFTDTTQFQQQFYEELQTLAGFYNSLNGATLPFLYTEANDSSVVNQQFGIGDGVTTQFQLCRTWGGFTEPVYGSPVIQYMVVNHAQVTSGFTVSATGLVTFASPPAAGAALMWTGTYQWLCRFDDDNLDFSQFMSGMWELKKMTFSSELLP